MKKEETAAVVTSTRMLLRAVRNQSGLFYADEDWSPVSDITVEILARKLGCLVLRRPLAEGIDEIAIPGLGVSPAILVNTRNSPGMKRVALRHGLAHVLAGEVPGFDGIGIHFMSSALDYMSMAERRADLFALADLIPDRDLDVLERANYSSGEKRRWIRNSITLYAPSWPADRVDDRVELRIGL